LEAAQSLRGGSAGSRKYRSLTPEGVRDDNKNFAGPSFVEEFGMTTGISAGPSLVEEFGMTTEVWGVGVWLFGGDGVLAGVWLSSVTGFSAVTNCQPAEANCWC
jgi:hypothetical protein